MYFRSIYQTFSSTERQEIDNTKNTEYNRNETNEINQNSLSMFPTHMFGEIRIIYPETSITWHGCFQQSTDLWINPTFLFGRS